MRNHQTLAALKRARALIRDPRHWTQGSRAKNANGRWVPPESSTAESWCSVGALEWSTFTAWERDKSVDRFALKRSCMDELAIARGARDAFGMRLPSFNDNATHEAVIEMFAVAIANVAAGLARKTIRPEAVCA